MEHLLMTIERNVMYITLNRPERINAFSLEMMKGLEESLKRAEVDENVRAVVLSGSGRGFSAGGDVKEMAEATPQNIYDYVGKLNSCITKMKNLHKPIIVAVHGVAAGAGFSLALAADFILAASESKFILSFSQVGLIGDGGASYFLTKAIGPYRTKELFFSGSPITAEKAYELGLVNRVVPFEQLQELTKEYAEQLANGPSKAYGMMKRTIDYAQAASLEEVLELERTTQSLMVTTEDHTEGVQAFIEKRNPIFKGK
jgi:2-(1,2-epoxy-1,2-dihydrophenyl)acetyl-CoA isomerase